MPSAEVPAVPLAAPSATTALPRSVQVVVAGGGPVGLAAAVELGRRGVSCPVIEPRTTVSHARPRGKTINVRSMEHLRRWGIADRLRDRAPLSPAWSQDVVFCTSLTGYELSRFTDVAGELPAVQLATGITITDSPVIVPAQAQAGGWKAGALLPHRWRSPGGRSYDELGEGFTLLRRGGESDGGEIEKAARIRSVPIKIVDEPAPDGDGPALALVRPDRYLAWAGDRYRLTACRPRKLVPAVRAACLSQRCR